jgi:hypothetical protein
LVPVCRNVFLLVSIVGMLLSLSVAPGCCHRCLGTGEKAAPAEVGAETGTVGVAVTKEVPHSKEAVPEIMDGERTAPLPPRGDTEMPSHKILRTGNDNCGGAK